MSKTITNHPAVSHLDDCSDSDYKYYVILKEGYVFGTGRNAGGTNMRFNSVSDFRSYATSIRPVDPDLDDELQGYSDADRAERKRERHAAEMKKVVGEPVTGSLAKALGSFF